MRLYPNESKNRLNSNNERLFNINLKDWKTLLKTIKNTCSGTTQTLPKAVLKTALPWEYTLENNNERLFNVANVWLNHIVSVPCPLYDGVNRGALWELKKIS
jgi:hypothetical protein